MNQSGKHLFVLLTALLALAAPAAASPILFTAALNGATEEPPNASGATGSASVTLDTAMHTLHIQLTYAGLTAPATAGHIHCCTATPGMGNIGVAVPFVGLPNLTAATYEMDFDTSMMATYTSAFLTASGGTAADAEAALLAGMMAGEAYVNLHNVNNPAGEIRGFLAQAETGVPEPASLALIGAGLIGVWRLRRKKIAA